MHDAPRLEICDDLFDDPADLVDLGVELLLSVQESAMSGFLDRCEHVVADVSLVADPVVRVHG